MQALCGLFLKTCTTSSCTLLKYEHRRYKLLEFSIGKWFAVSDTESQNKIRSLKNTVKLSNLDILRHRRNLTNLHKHLQFRIL